MQIITPFIRDQATKTNIGPIVDKMNIRTLPKLAGISVIATGGPFKAMRIVLNGKPSVERIAPYVYGGDDFVTPLVAGQSYTLEVSLHDDREAKTAATATASYTFTVAAAEKIKKGVVCYLEDGLKKLDPIFKDLGVTHIRVWDGKQYDSTPSAGDVALAKEWVKAGYDLTFTLQNPDPPENSYKAGEFYKRKLGAYAGAVSKFAIGNEPNLWKYFHGTLQQYIDLCLTPASEAMRGNGVKVVGGAVSENVEKFAELTRRGYLDLVDYAAFHPYGSNAKQHAGRLKDVFALCNGKPLISTEWNIHSGSATGWAGNIGEMWEAAKLYLAEVYYYRLFYKTDSTAGWQALLHDKATLTRMQPFYGAFRSLRAA